MSGAISRTVKPGAPMGVAPRGMLAAPLPLVFPNKNPGEKLDYAVDFSDELEGGVDTALSAFSITVSPPGQLVPTAAKIVGLAVTFLMTGGVGGMSYEVAVNASTPSSLQVQAFVAIYVMPVPNAQSGTGPAGLSLNFTLPNSLLSLAAT